MQKKNKLVVFRQETK